MLLYESLLAAPPEALYTGKLIPASAAVQRRLREAVVVRVDNVARYYAESPQVVWRLDVDFPCLAAPWPITFFEYAIPPYLNMNGRHDPSPIRDGRQ